MKFAGVSTDWLAPHAQVGSKNAAFFMGRSVKVCTRQSPRREVHQLCIDAQKLEERYRNSKVRTAARRASELQLQMQGTCLSLR